MNKSFEVIGSTYGTVRERNYINEKCDWVQFLFHLKELLLFFYYFMSYLNALKRILTKAPELSLARPPHLLINLMVASPKITNVMFVNLTYAQE